MLDEVHQRLHGLRFVFVILINLVHLLFQFRHVTCQEHRLQFHQVEIGIGNVVGFAEVFALLNVFRDKPVGRQTQLDVRRLTDVDGKRVAADDFLSQLVHDAVRSVWIVTGVEHRQVAVGKGFEVDSAVQGRRERRQVAGFNRQRRERLEIQCGVQRVEVQQRVAGAEQVFDNLDNRSDQGLFLLVCRRLTQRRA